MSFHVPEKYRLRGTPMEVGTPGENYGAFMVPFEGRDLRVIASDGMGWEHVSVSLRNRTPNWREMCLIKDLFWDPEDVVIQFHPRASEYVNFHAFCLHLWRPIGVELPTPPAIMVGPTDEMLKELRR